MLRKVVSVAFLVVFVVGWAITLRPVALGGPATYVVVTGSSMEPTYTDGDLVVLREEPSYEVGDIVTFPVPEGEPGGGALIVHRVVGGTADAYEIQGDNNDRLDEWSPSAEDVLGSAWFHAPGVGKLLRYAMDPALLAAAAGGLTVVLVLLRRDPKSPAATTSETTRRDEMTNCEEITKEPQHV